MDDIRKPQRYPTQRRAQYFLEEVNGNGQECTIINASRKGLGMLFNTSEEIDVGTFIHLEVPDSNSLETINVRGELKWCKTTESALIGGIVIKQYA
jgi:hypothetical protein